MTMDQPCRILIVGAGSIGERQLRCFQQTGRARVSFCEPDAELRKTIADRYSVEGFSALEEALGATRFDGVVICTPAHLHVPLARTAMRAGAAVLIEKPLGVSLDGVDELLRLRDERNLTAAVAYVLRFSPALREARSFLQDGGLGRPMQATVAGGQHFPAFRPDYRKIYYAHHRTGGGAIQDALTHFVHAVEWLLGPTDTVFCDASRQCLEGVEVEDTVNAVARNGEVMVGYTYNQFQAANETSMWVHCERGSVVVEFHRQRWGVLRQGEEKWTWYEAPVPDRDTLFVAQANAFLDRIAGAAVDLCGLEEAARTLAFNLAALESARTGRRVEL